MSRQQTRIYTCELRRIKAIWFKPLFGLTSNQFMKLNGVDLSEEHTNFELSNLSDNQIRLTFVIKGCRTSFKINKNTAGVAPRLFFECSYCNHSRSSLYAARNAYACRECLELKYVCQSETELDRLGRKIRKRRFQTWGELAHRFDGNNLFEDSYYWPRPKGRWNAKFKQDQDCVRLLESKFYGGLSAYMDAMFSVSKIYTGRGASDLRESNR